MRHRIAARCLGALGLRTADRRRCSSVPLRTADTTNTAWSPLASIAVPALALPAPAGLGARNTGCTISGATGAAVSLAAPWRVTDLGAVGCAPVALAAAANDSPALTRFAMARPQRAAAFARFGPQACFDGAAHGLERLLLRRLVIRHAQHDDTFVTELDRHAVLALSSTVSPNTASMTLRSSLNGPPPWRVKPSTVCTWQAQLLRPCRVR